ncbi:MAG: hypothetical protein KDK78_00845 [Chlamydiia bacterium]|nr:hypothetical protein [Chlamydiia bacterium]
MDIIFAKIFAIYFCAIGLAFLVRPGGAASMYDRVLKDEGLLLLSGLIALVIGAIIVSFHNIWVPAWPVAITILGWWAVLKGWLLLAWPRFARSFQFMGRQGAGLYRVIGLLAFVVGACFAWVSWLV